MDQLEFNLNIKTNFLEYNGQKGRREIAISIRPSFRGLLFHFYSTKLQFLVMFTINDIFHVILRVKGVLRYEHWRKINRFLDSIIPFSIDNDIFYSDMNNDERNGCVFTQRKLFRSLEAFSFTHHVTISCCHRIRFKM